MRTAGTTLHSLCTDCVLQGLHSAVHEIPRRLWNSNVHCRIHHSPPLDSVLCQMNPSHVITQYFLNILLIVYFHLCLDLSSGLFVFLWPNGMCISQLSHACCVPWTYHSSFDRFNIKWWRVQVMKLIIMQVPSSAVTSCLSGLVILPSAVRSDVINLCCSLTHAEQQVGSNIIVLYHLIFRVLDRRRQDVWVWAEWLQVFP
jgi:hypothetical protein